MRTPKNKEWVLNQQAADDFKEFVKGMIDNLAEKMEDQAAPKQEVQKTWYNTRKHLLVNYKLDRPFLQSSRDSFLLSFSV